MTLVMAWRSEKMLTVCTDTRIESESKERLTDVGQKLFHVPIEMTPFGLDAEPIRKPSVGFAFAGNTLMAQSCCAIASTCLVSLSAREDRGIAPAAIAHFFERSAEYVSRERAFLRPRTPSRFEAIVFGWDTSADAPFVYEIKVKPGEAGMEATSVRKDVPVGGLLYFGSGAGFIADALRDTEQDDSPRTSVNQLMEAAIDASELRSVGGAMQFATASCEGVRLRPLMRVGPTGRAEFLVLGCDIRRLMEPEGMVPGAGAVALPTPHDPE